MELILSLQPILTLSLSLGPDGVKEIAKEDGGRGWGG